MKTLVPKDEFGVGSFLMVGCGNSKLSEDMAKDGYPFVTNVDIAPSVVEKMRENYRVEN